MKWVLTTPEIEIQSSPIETFNKVGHLAPIVVNCTGLAARRLVEDDQLSGTKPLVLTINGRPTLTGPSASPNPASQAGDVVIGVTYTDINGDPPFRAGAIC